MCIAVRIMLPFLILLLSSACVEQRSPLQVSEVYWSAVREGDVDTIRRHLIAESMRGPLNIEDLLPISDVRFGRTVIDGDRAWVETTVMVTSDRPFTLPTKTVLFFERKQWRVEYRSTMETLSNQGGLASVIDAIEKLSDQFQDSFDETLDELERTLPEVKREVERLEDHIRTRIPELQKRLEEFERELEEALKDPRRGPGESKGI